MFVVFIHDKKQSHYCPPVLLHLNILFKLQHLYIYLHFTWISPTKYHSLQGAQSLSLSLFYGSLFYVIIIGMFVVYIHNKK